MDNQYYIIGFGGTQYTLWHISEQEEYVSNTKYLKVYYHYIQNLSIVKDEAIKKAKDLLNLSDIKVDMDLKSPNSFERREQLSCSLDGSRVRLYFYSGLPIHVSDNFSDLVYMAERYGNIHAINRLVELGYVYDAQLGVLTKEEYEKGQLKEREYNSAIQTLINGDILKNVFLRLEGDYVTLSSETFYINLYLSFDTFTDEGKNIQKILNQFHDTKVDLSIETDGKNLIRITTISYSNTDVFIPQNETIIAEAIRFSSNTSVFMIGDEEVVIPMENKENFYNGFSYFLPVFKDKSKRIKGKKVEMKLKRNDYFYEIIDLKIQKESV
jgi:hypothetical protein